MAEYALVGTCELDLKLIESVSLIFTVLVKFLSNPLETFSILSLSGWKIVLTLSALPIPLFALQN